MLDYMESLSVKVNTICRGRAFSAAAIILAYGTGTRMISKRSSVMFHQSSSFLSGKLTDMTAYVDNIKHIETTIYDLLGSKTKKDANWWRDKMRSDLFLSPDELVEYGVIDQII
jgi:ATP-dependent Clp protease protease subunit